MSYPGNATLTREMQERILSTFEQTLAAAASGNRQEATLGCDFILRLDSLFGPARQLQERLATGEGAVETADLATAAGLSAADLPAAAPPPAATPPPAAAPPAAAAPPPAAPPAGAPPQGVESTPAAAAAGPTPPDIDDLSDLDLEMGLSDPPPEPEREAAEPPFDLPAPAPPQPPATDDLPAVDELNDLDLGLEMPTPAAEPPPAATPPPAASAPSPAATAPPPAASAPPPAATAPPPAVASPPPVDEPPLEAPAAIEAPPPGDLPPSPEAVAAEPVVSEPPAAAEPPAPSSASQPAVAAEPPAPSGATGATEPPGTPAPPVSPVAPDPAEPEPELPGAAAPEQATAEAAAELEELDDLDLDLGALSPDEPAAAATDEPGPDAAPLDGSAAEAPAVEQTPEPPPLEPGPEPAAASETAEATEAAEPEPAEVAEPAEAAEPEAAEPAEAAEPEAAEAPEPAPASVEIPLDSEPAAQLDTESQQRIDDLLAEGQQAFDGGEYQGAIDAWSRIFLIDIDHAEANQRIEEARKLKAEADRKVEEKFHEGLDHLEAGETDAAAECLRAVLEMQPSHLQARDYLEKLEAGEVPVPAERMRPAEAEAAGEELEALESEEEGELDEAPKPRPDRGTKAVGERVVSVKKSPFKSKGFLAVAAAGLIAVLAGGWYLFDNWSSLFPNSAQEQPAASAPDPLARAKGLHDEGKTPIAIAQLRRLPPDSPQYDEAQALIAQWELEQAPTDSGPQGPSPQELARREALIAEAAAAADRREFMRTSELLSEAATVAPLSGTEVQLLARADEQLQELQNFITIFREGEWDLGLRDLWLLQESDPGNRDVTRLLVDSYYNLGLRALQRKDVQVAAEQFQEALALSPDDPELRRVADFAATYETRSTDLLYRIYVKYLPFR